MNWDSIRPEFPALSRWTYLNTATFGQVPNRAKAALDAHFARRNELACDDFIAWFDDMDRIRQSTARLIHCSAEDIAFMTNASQALSLLLGGIVWKPGDQILTLENEFPNHIYHPEFLAAEGVRLVQSPPGQLLEAVTERTRVVAISTVNYTNGYTAPVHEIGAFLRSRGILFYLDGTQSVGALDIDVSAVQPDVFTVNAYKWLISPNGAGFAVIRPDVRAWLRPSVIGWRSDRSWRSVDNLNHGSPQFADTAEKYEAGMLNFPSLYAMGESIAMLLELGTKAVETRVLELAQKTRAIVERFGATVPYTGSGIVAARFARRDAAELNGALRAEGILTAARHGSLRISPHFYNSQLDLDKLEIALKHAFSS